MTYRVVSHAVGASLVAVTVWLLVVAIKPMPGEALVVVSVVIGLVALLGITLFFLLRWGTTEPTGYWWTKDPSGQVPRIITMIVLSLAVQIAVSAYFDGQGRLGETSTAVFLLVWTTIPLASIAFGFLKLPSRTAKPSRLKLIVASAVSLLIAGTMTSLAFTPGIKMAGAENWYFVILSVIVGAVNEELVWRVLLMTALLGASGSRLIAVLLSGFGFALMHAPLVLLQPVLRSDWPMLSYAANSFAPEFLLHVAVGWLMGIVWLRTGSFTLIVAVHALINLGPSLVLGL